MCGIAGFVHRDATLADEATLARLGNLQAHRGPDHFGTAVRGSAGFAHNRLSILDPTEAGHQPFTDDHHVLCYNGEIYNYLDFRRELSFEGVELVSQCDTEVLFHMLVRYGVPETLARIQGMFAFSFYDCRQQRLFLCRDRLGIKPLHWCDNGTTIYWASESKTLALGLDLNPDPVKTLFSLGLNGESFWEQTLFEGVQQVPPGCYLTFSPESGPEVVEYFHATDWVDREMFGELDRADSQSIVDEFARLFRQSVRRMLMSDVPMGAFVSGGIDSSLITSVAADHDDHLQLFTADVAGPMSEFTAAFQLADSTGCELHSFTFEPDMMLRDWSETTYYYECPIVSFPTPFRLRMWRSLHDATM